MFDAPSTSKAISVLVADSNQLESQLLVSALRRRPEFVVTSCSSVPDEILDAVSRCRPAVAVLNTSRSKDGWPEMSPVRRLHLAHPSLPKILLLDAYDRDTVVNAFRSGARGIFCFSEYPFRLLCKCIHVVHAGQVWINSEQLKYLVEAVIHVPSLRVVNARGLNLLSAREEQVVALVADGLSNRGSGQRTETQRTHGQEVPVPDLR